MQTKLIENIKFLLEVYEKTQIMINYKYLAFSIAAYFFFLILFFGHVK
jgi:hypothetical protein